MTYKNIEACREVRMWIVQIIAPTIVTGSILMSNPEFRNKVDQKVEGVKNFVANKIRR